VFDKLNLTERHFRPGCLPPRPSSLHNRTYLAAETEAEIAAYVKKQRV